MAAERLKDLLTFLGALNDLRAGETPAQKRLLEGCIDDFKSGPKIDLRAGTHMLEEVKVSKIPSWMKDYVVQAVEDKMMKGVEPEVASRRKPLQRNMFLYNYFNQEEWETMSNPRLTLETNLHTLASRFAAIGLTCPSEPTFVVANATLHAAIHQGPPQKLKIDSRKAFSILQDLKVIVKAKTKKSMHSGITLYPQEPSGLGHDFLKMAYEEKHAICCPLDVKVIINLAEELPARKTKENPAMRHGSHRDDQLKDWIGNMLMNNFFHGHGKTKDGSEHGGIPLTFFGGEVRKRKAAALQIADVEVDAEKPEPVAQKHANEVQPKEEEPKTAAAPANIDKMANMIQCQLDEDAKKNDEKNTTGGNKKIAKAKAKPKPAAKSTKDACSKVSLTFSTSAQPPQYMDKVTIYTCPNSCSCANHAGESRCIRKNH